jgi:hypothetical protein
VIWCRAVADAGGFVIARRDLFGRGHLGRDGSGHAVCPGRNCECSGLSRVCEWLD